MIKKSPIKSNKVTYKNCQKSNFTIELCYYYCTNCGFGLGHVIDYRDKSDYDRTNFYQKSIYQRKYFLNKIEEANKKFNLNLSGNDKYELYKKINEKFKRKSLINIFMIKKLLNDTNKILLNLSEKLYNFIIYGLKVI